MTSCLHSESLSAALWTLRAFVSVNALLVWLDQVSIAGSAIATLQKELRSSSPRKIIKPVKSPSPSRRAVEVRATSEPLPPPFKDVRYQSQFELQPGGAYAVSEEEFEDWEPQVGPTPVAVILPSLPPNLTPCGLSPAFDLLHCNAAANHHHHHEDPSAASSSSSSCPELLTSSPLSSLQGFYLS